MHGDEELQAQRESQVRGVSRLRLRRAPRDDRKGQRTWWWFSRMYRQLVAASARKPKTGGGQEGEQRRVSMSARRERGAEGQDALATKPAWNQSLCWRPSDHRAHRLPMQMYQTV